MLYIPCAQTHRDVFPSVCGCVVCTFHCVVVWTSPKHANYLNYSTSQVKCLLFLCLCCVCAVIWTCDIYMYVCQSITIATAKYFCCKQQKKDTGLYPCVDHKQLDYPLPFIIIYTSNVRFFVAILV